ncbi:hypothetical protein L0V05_02650 [Tabrizicola sp. J26]|uniref:hypothetical protein n=1 Tax=Alitabrizicola rongguiensis TaxID=2909234 RepID=UPI001F193B2D|nr:hypothetical protein [Tabrizicola rongguiensis]MCF1707708.1 hypothetical protein [Tabrizicola rongguiensis]
MSDRPLYLELALLAGIALLVGGPAGAWQFQVMGGAPEYFRTGDYSPVAPQQTSDADSSPSSAFANDFQRTAGGVTFDPPMDFFPGSSGNSSGSEPTEPAAPPAPALVLLSELVEGPGSDTPAPQDFAPPSGGQLETVPTLEAPAPVPLPPALPLLAAVLAGLALLPGRRRA